MNELKDLLEILSLIATTLGVPIAIAIFFNEKRKERRDREYGTYNALDDKYLDFLNLCLLNMDLGIYEKADKELSEEQQLRSNIIFDVLISILERAYLMYQGHSDQIRKSQWVGWNSYIEDWMNYNRFRIAWETLLNSQFDTNFIEYMNEIYHKKAVPEK